MTVEKEGSSGGRCVCVWGGGRRDFKKRKGGGRGGNYIKPCLKAEAVKKKRFMLLINGN